LPTLQLAEQQLRAGSFERHWQSIVLGHRFVRLGGGGLDVALGRQPHAAAAGTDGEHP
jgi:hypothetical protein